MKQYKITLVRSKIVFYYDNSISLLVAIESNRINPDYGCRAGFCGSCSARVISGEFHYPREPLAFVKPDHILLCCAIVDSDMEIDI